MDNLEHERFQLFHLFRQLTRKCFPIPERCKKRLQNQLISSFTDCRKSRVRMQQPVYGIRKIADQLRLLTRSVNAAVAQIDSVGDGNLWIVDDFEETVAQVLDIVFDALGGRSQRHVQRTASGFRRVNCNNNNNGRFIS